MKLKDLIESNRSFSNRFYDKLYQTFYGQIPRTFTLKAKELFGNRSVIGAEIGVYLADNSLSLLRNLNIELLFLIDPFEDYQEYGYYKNNYDVSKEKLKDYRRNTVFIKDFSSKAIDVMPPLDFCYIDGNHHYEHVKEDIELYWDKIKLGGIIGGHDIVSAHDNEFGVIPAVTEFAVERKLKLWIEPPDWFIIKDK